MEKVEIYFDKMPDYVGNNIVRVGLASDLSLWVTSKKADGWKFLGFISSTNGQLGMFERIVK